jgi:hypothetical protein
MIFYYLLQYFQWDTTWMVSKGPQILNAIFVAATTDWSIWYMSQWMLMSTIKRTDQTKNADAQKSRRLQNVVAMGDDNSAFNFCVYCCLTSWFNAYALVRTYSNSLETLLIAWSVALVSPVSVSKAFSPQSSAQGSIAHHYTFRISF